MANTELRADSTASNQGDRIAGTTSGGGQNPLLHEYLQQPLPQPKPTDPPQKWVVVTDMAILFDNTGKNGHFGAQDKEKRLEELENKTKGTGVTIVAQEVVTPNENDPNKTLSTSKDGYQVRTVVFKDGQKYEGPVHASKGVQGDFKDEMQYAAQFPTDKTAVEINAHGLGHNGMAGGQSESPDRRNGSMTPEEMSNIILTAEKGKKVDVVNFDSCLMAEDAALRAMSKSTKYVVASELPEQVNADGKGHETDSQNSDGWISKVLDKPDMSGGEFAKAAVDEANDTNNRYYDSNKGEYKEGTPTLASFDMSHYQELDNRMSDFGGALSASMAANPENRKQINDIIDKQKSVTTYPGGPDGGNPDANKYDLRGFADQVDSKIRSGEIKDPDGKLAASIKALDTTMDDGTVITSSHGKIVQPTGSQQGLDRGEVSVYLPNWQERRKDRAQYDQQVKIVAGDKPDGWNQFLKDLDQPPPPLVVPQHPASAPERMSPVLNISIAGGSKRPSDNQ